MTRTWRVFALLPLLALLGAGAVLASGEGRMLGTVVDEDGNPIKGAQVTVTSPDLPPFKEETKTKKNGVFSMVFSKAYLRYVYHIEAESYAPTEEEVKTDLGGTTRHTFTLYKGVSSGVTATGEKAASTSNKAIFAFNAGAEAFQAKDYDGAKEKFLSAIEADSQLYQAHSALADVYLATGDYQSAIESAARAIAQQPSYLPAHRVQYEAYKKLGDKDKADEAQAAIAALGQNSEEAKRIFNEGVELNKADNKEGALAKFQEAATMDPSLPDAYNAIATLAFNLERWQEAAEASEKLLALQPDNEKAMRIRYDAYVNLKDQDKVGEALVDLASVDPTFAGNNLYNLGIGYFNDSKYDKAIDAFTKALAADPSHAKAHYYLGLSAVNTGNNTLAKEHLQKFVEMAPADPDAAAAKEMVKYLS
ncbi:MAG: tetratricopeptide repeat protein [Acidobacteria bacterium]|nr:tetratricopeptide repeat protein [Acidobacteriota bacterium]